VINTAKVEAGGRVVVVGLGASTHCGSGRTRMCGQQDIGVDLNPGSKALAENRMTAFVGIERGRRCDLVAPWSRHDGVSTTIVVECIGTVD